MKASGDTNASYTITGISVEYEVVTNPYQARLIKQQYQGCMAILYERVLRHRRIVKKDTVWNVNLNTQVIDWQGDTVKYL